MLWFIHWKRDKMKDIRICFIGNSFVNGTGDPEKLGWCTRVCSKSTDKSRDITYYNLGIRRETSSDIKERWEAEAEQRFFEGSDNRVVFSFGVNDTVIEEGKMRVENQQSIQNIHAILTKAKMIYNGILMIGPAPIDDKEANERIKALDVQFEEACQELEVPYLSLFETLVDDPLWQEEVSSSDGAHPQAKGYALMADIVLNWEKWRYR